MGRRPKDNLTGDLFAFKPVSAEITYKDPRTIQGPSISSRFARAISQACKNCGKSRAEIAREMSEYLGEEVTENTLNAYASEARESHTINVHRFAALIHATGAFELLTLLPGEFGFGVVDRKYMPLCERVVHRAQLVQHRAEIDRLIALDDREISESDL